MTSTANGTSTYADLWAEVEQDREDRAVVAEVFADYGDEGTVGPDGTFGVLTRQDGFVEYHEVRATEPWRPSLVRRDERPAVGRATVKGRHCARCGHALGKADLQRTYCRGTVCRRARTAERVRRHRAAQ
jgi:hypothetical protein